MRKYASFMCNFELTSSLSTALLLSFAAVRWRGIEDCHSAMITNTYRMQKEKRRLASYCARYAAFSCRDDLVETVCFAFLAV